MDGIPITDVIVDSPLYDKETHGSKAYMGAQWLAHNAANEIASSGPVGFWLMQRISGSRNPLESSDVLDIRGKTDTLRRHRVIYTIISWVY